MATLSKAHLLTAVSVLAIMVAACSDDDNPTDGNTDTTPPTVSSVTPIDAFHFDVTFNEEVTRSSAEDDGHYVILESAAPSPAPGAWTETPGDTLHSVALSLRADKKTVAITTESSMAGLNYTLNVLGVSDTHGNEITAPVSKLFTGSNNPDVTAPEIVQRSPAPNASGVGTGAAVTIQFSEPVEPGSIAGGFEFTPSASLSIDLQNDGTLFIATPYSPFDNATQYFVTLTGVRDIVGNIMATTSWSFTTTSTTDNTPPTLVSTIPANLSTNVNVNTNLSLTFSEAINQVEFNVELSPDPGDGVPTWSNGGKTITFDPTAPLLDNQQYTFTIFPDGVRDLAGNGFAGLKTVVFTTGATLEDGSIAGTIAGDPGTAASDPTGAIVVAALGSVFDGGGDDFGVAGSAIVAGNNTYSLTYLPDDVYYPLAVKETSGDGIIDPSGGDAVGAYGIDFATLDFTPDSVIIAGGNHETGVNFPLIDPSAITGTVQYDGTYAAGFYPVFVGLFDTSGFDPSDAPVVGSEAFWPDFREWGFNSLDQLLIDDDYYVGAFMDVNSNGTYEPAVDPAAFYGGLPTPTVVHIEDGSDVIGITIVLQDPLTTTSIAGVVWPAAKHNAGFQHLCDVVRQSQAVAKK